MSHKSVRDLIEDVATDLRDDLTFVYAKTFNVNSLKDKRDTVIQLDLLKGTPVRTNNTFNTTWESTLLFYKLDRVDGTEQETAAILDSTDALVQQFIRKMNVQILMPDTITFGTDDIDLSFGQAIPMTKVLVDCLTGWMIPIKMECPDDFNYCSIYP